MKNKKKIHTELAISVTNAFWTSSMEVNWIVKARWRLGLLLQSTKLPLVSTSVMSGLQPNKME